MNFFKVLLAGVACVASTLFIATATHAEPPRRPHPVGMTLLHYEDASRLDWSGTAKRPLATALWYPAVAGTEESPWRVSIFNAGVNAIGAPMAASPVKLPLIVLSHGTGGSAATMAWLAETLASHGYLVAAVNHHGNTGYESAQRPEGFIVWWDRPKDITVLIDKLLADPRYGPRIDASRIGVAGFSVGGYTALATVGARLDHALWQGFCAARPTNANCMLPPEARFSMSDVSRLLDQDPRIKTEIGQMGGALRDSRVKAAFAVAPVLGPALTTRSLGLIGVPVRIVVGSKDDQAIPEFNAQPLAANIPGAELEVLSGVTHYTFLSNCNLIGRTVARQFCSDPEGVDRDATHTLVGMEAVAFFDRVMKPELVGQAAQR